MVDISLLNQDPRDAASPTHLKIAELLRAPGLQKVRLLMAYVNWQGLSAIADPLEEFLRRGGVVESVFGVDNGVTTPEALIYSLYLSEEFPSYNVAAVVPWAYRDSIFHPKFLQFDFQARRTLLIGSANLTGGGLLRNHEIGVVVDSPKAANHHRSFQSMWIKYLKDSSPITLKMIRDLSAANQLAKERVRAEAPNTGKQLPSIGLTINGRKKPALFKHILSSGLPTGAKHRALAKADSLSIKPKRLYLQILRETGGGHQVQLPVATLAAFFGVARGQSKAVRFRFDAETVAVDLTHFANNTHRVRLRPIQSVPRPAIVEFSRTTTKDSYNCEIVTGPEYQRTLSRCTEQTRAGSRRWGLS